LKVTDLISPMKVTADVLESGSDVSQHGENLYPFDYTAIKENVS
jgi:Amt family ammonium transporter